MKTSKSFIFFGLLQFAIISAASACDTSNTKDCGILDVTNLKLGSATEFFSDLTSDASSNQLITKSSTSLSNVKGDSLISEMQGSKYFNQTPFTSSTLKFDYGTLGVSNLAIKQQDVITYTFLGASAYNTDQFSVTGGTITGSTFNNQSTKFGTTITDTVTATGSTTQLAFKFTDVSVNNNAVTNGCTGNNCKGSFGILEQTGGYTIGGKKYSALLIYNDTGSKDGDFNDMVIGVNSTAIPMAAPVPEPSEGALLLSGIGLLGFIAVRRKSV